MLKIFLSVSDLKQFLESKKNEGETVGFVPTMGALHAGHVSLISESLLWADVTVCSIFVNPTQFNDPNDYNKYPRNIETDKMILENAGCDCLFLPDISEIYPDESFKHIDFDPGRLGNVLDGKYRPGHFAGMVAVVKRLLDIVDPDKVFFGQKDYQQYRIVKNMVAYYNMPVEIVKCPTLRETNGLAMSSRNQRLSSEEREKASLIYKSLLKAAQEIRAGELSFETIEAGAMFDLERDGGFNVDYFDICSADSLEKVKTIQNKGQMVILTADWIRDVRLIDNILL